MHPFHQYLSDKNPKNLPGKNAQLKMQPVPITDGLTFPEPDKEAGHPSSVLIPIYENSDNDLEIIFTLRTNSIRHAGQISFPGGRSEGNEAPVETALRESFEEVGLNPKKVVIAGTLSPLFLYRSNNQITPFVGFLNEKPELQINPNEVEEAFSVPIRSLLDENHLIWEEWTIRDYKMNVPYWNIHSTPLWGATAMITNELLELYKEFLDR